ncbi:hypothetical protein B0H19DRAFT_1167835 [Mycena capillaripes]|nr:hypothetical protein B0H19DRAFT_1167835 [Mycena capillaripes]
MLHFHPPRENDSNIFCDAAVAKVAELARAIALWPAAGKVDEMWDSVLREITLLITDEVKTHRRIADEVKTHRRIADEIIHHAPQPVRKTPSHLDCDQKVPTPVVLDPRNYLPTPPSTPPPTLISRRPASKGKSLKVLVPALSPSAADADAGTEKSLETFHVPDSVQIPRPSSSPARSSRRYCGNFIPHRPTLVSAARPSADNATPAHPFDGRNRIMPPDRLFLRRFNTCCSFTEEAGDAIRELNVRFLFRQVETSRVVWRAQDIHNPLR